MRTEEQEQEATQNDDPSTMPGAVESEEVTPLDLSFSPVSEEESGPSEETEESVEETEGSVEEAQESVEEEAKQAQKSVEDAPVQTTVNKPMVPKSRLDEVLAKHKALQKQLDEVNSVNATLGEVPEPYDFDAKENEYQNMVLDGESAKAVALRGEIRKAERSSLEREMQEQMSQTVRRDRETTALQKAATAMENAYPEFARDSDRFSEDLTNEVVELRDAFILKGLDPVAALSKAVNFVVKDNDLGATEVDAAPKKHDEVSKRRKQVDKKLRDAESQPPDMPTESALGAGEHRLNAGSMSDAEFDALPESELKRLRGDSM